MLKIRRIWRCLGFTTIFLFSAFLKAQDAGSQAGQLWKAATTAFSTGDYANAAANLKAIINSSATTATWLNNAVIPPAPPNRQWLEPVFFMLGAAEFNAKDWPNAITTFNAYRQLFPKSTRLSQVTFSLAQANLLGGHPEDSITLFASLLPLSDYHAKALLLLVQADERAGKGEDAITLLEKEKTAPNVSPELRGKINMRLAMLCFDNKDVAKVASLLQEMDSDILHVQNIVEFNTLATKEGDLFLFHKKVDDALKCYRLVRSNEEIAAIQTRQIEILHQQRNANLVRIQADPLNSSQLQVANKDIDDQIAKDEQVSAKYRDLPPVLPPLYLRIGRAYATEEEFWEAAVVYREIMRRYPSCAESEGALYGSIVAFYKLKQNDRDGALCQTYLTQYPQGKYTDSVRFLRGAAAYNAEDFDNAITYFNDALKSPANNPRREQIELLLGDIKLRQGKYDEAVASYRHYEQDYPETPATGNSAGGSFGTASLGNFEKAEYRIALALVLGGKLDDAEKALDAYLQKYPEGAYVADVEYRLDVIKFANKQYDQVISDSVAWQQKYGTASPLAEVLSLMGDCYASEDRDDEAIKTYTASYQAARSPNVLNYSIFAAAKLLQKHTRWADIVQMFQEFIENNPDHPTAVAAIVWIGRADIKLGKVEQAKQFMADTAKQYLNDPSREAVDEIITQLAQLYAHRHLQLSPPPTAVPPVSPAVLTSASVPPSIGAGLSSADTTLATAASNVQPPVSAAEDPTQALEEILTIPDLDSQATARARILYAKAELARLQRQNEVAKQILLEIGKDFKPEDLSPILLGKVGDCLVQEGQTDQAVSFYNQLMDEYAKSAVVDYAYNGLGQIAYAQKDYQKADRYFSKALDKGLAEGKLKEITLGEAQTLLELNRPEEARPLFEQVASTRAWRGEATALSVFSLGQIEMQLGKFAEANAYYQRVFVAYQGYPDVQAKAYLKSGQAFEKLGRVTEAVNTYSEMLRNPHLSSFPEFSDAKQRLDQLAQK